MITREIVDFLDRQKLGYVSTVSPNGMPNLSPKGTIIGWGTDMLAFADIRSPDTVRNILHNPHVEISVIDPLVRRGYLFQGKARIIHDGPVYKEILTHYRKNRVQSPINSIVLVDVSGVSEVISPLYDAGASEQEIRSRWKKHFESL